MFSLLPSDILRLLASYFDLQEILSFSRINKKTYSSVYINELFLKYLGLKYLTDHQDRLKINTDIYKYLSINYDLKKVLELGYEKKLKQLISIIVLPPQDALRISALRPSRP